MKYLLFLLLPGLAIASMSIDKETINIGESFEVTLQGHSDRLTDLKSQIEPPFRLLSGSEANGTAVLQVTSWTPGRHPLSFSLPNERPPLYTDVYGITVRSPKEPDNIVIDEFLQGLLPLKDRKQSLLSKENRALLKASNATHMEGSDRDSSALDRSTLLWAILIAVATLSGLGYLIRRFYASKGGAKAEEVDPKDRALKELASLVKKNFPESGQFDRFYVELTTIMRRYIEKQYRLAAHEQTTEEFLASAAIDTQFTQPMRELLCRFLNSADLVKFARHSPDPSDCQGAMIAAKKFINF